MEQAVSRQGFNGDARILYQANLHGIYRRHSGTETGFLGVRLCCPTIFKECNSEVIS